MATALIGNNMIAGSFRTNISSTTASGIVSGSNQVLTSNISANPTLGSNNYTYQWSQTGTTITFTAGTSNSTNCTYGSLSIAGSTTIYCTVTDTWSGVKSVTSNCTITWPVQTITQNVTISGSGTYNGSGQAYTLTTNTGPTPTGSPASFTSAGTYNSTNITLTPSAGYIVGTVTGSFTIVAATLTGTAVSPSATYNALSQPGTVITGVNATPGNYTGTTTISGINVGSYSPSPGVGIITGFGNYQGTVTGGTFTITPLSITGMTFTLNGDAFTTAQSRTAGTSYTIAVSSTTPSGALGTVSPPSTTVSAAGSYSLSSYGSGNYQGGPFTSPLLTLTAPPPPTQNVVISGTTTYNGSAQAYTLTGSPASPAPSGSPSTFTDAGTYTSSNISITAGSGYTLGSVTGSFVINPATISGTPVSATRTFNNSQQTATVITNVTPVGVITSGNYEGGVTASGTAVGTYSNYLTGTVNYTGTVNGGTLTIVNPAPALSVSVPSVTAGGDNNTQIIPTTINGGVPPYSLVSWVKTNTFGSGTFTSVSVNQATVEKQISRQTNFDFTVTISDSQGTTASASGIINWQIA